MHFTGSRKLRIVATEIYIHIYIYFYYNSVKLQFTVPEAQLSSWSTHLTIKY